ncbi:hypothetical protein B0919_09950 [Hymenobacter sp. CRA2]|nr:hypothetical protein B0919_09950 [Hymenobacter sp. CRA2]
MPAAASPGASAPAEKSYSVAQGLAMFQLFKDAVTILQLNVLLVFAIIIPIGVPGLLLCAWRWRFAIRPTSRTAALWHWSLTLGHELACTWLFVQLSQEPPDPDFPNWHFLAAGYIIGSLTSVLALAEAWARNKIFGSVSNAPLTQAVKTEAL